MTLQHSTLTTLFFLLAGVTFACSGPGVAVDTEVAKQNRLASYQTYTIVSDPIADAEGELRDSVYDLLVREEIEEQMLQRGYSEATTPERADLRVFWYGLVQDADHPPVAKRVNQHYAKLGYQWSDPTHMNRGQPSTQQHTDSVIIIDMIAADTNTVVFRAEATTDFTEGEAKDTQTWRIEEAVQEIFEDFPAES